jgi:hypothetical protein
METPSDIGMVVLYGDTIVLGNELFRKAAVEIDADGISYTIFHPVEGGMQIRVPTERLVNASFEP